MAEEVEADGIGITTTTTTTAIEPLQRDEIVLAEAGQQMQGGVGVGVVDQNALDGEQAAHADAVIRMGEEVDKVGDEKVVVGRGRVLLLLLLVIVDNLKCGWAARTRHCQIDDAVAEALRKRAGTGKVRVGGEEKEMANDGVEVDGEQWEESMVRICADGGDEGVVEAQEGEEEGRGLRWGWTGD